jgi:beta-glucosidase
VEEPFVVKQCEEAMAPQERFLRLKPGTLREDGNYEESYEAVPTRTIDLRARVLERLPEEYEITGNCGLTLQDVAAGACTMEEFIAQLTKEELAMIVRGEGMCSIKVTPGTAAAFGGVSDKLLSYGIPIGCCADGPSGIRMDGGLKATQLPIGTLLACTWDPKMVEELFTMQGEEMVRNRIDTLLGPGINIHRHPLNGRNFEYFSEDPLIIGKMAVAVVRGIGSNGVYATVKHFACNSQEHRRHMVEALVSQRALREIYLKGFELAVQEGNAQSIMTSYNPINGHWAASNYDLNTTLLRKEWGFTGMVMTDWWSTMNDVTEGGEASSKRTGDMVRAQNDVFMVVNNNGAELNAFGDDTLEALEQGRLTVGELQRSAMNICRLLMKMPTFQRVDQMPVGTPLMQAVERQETERGQILQNNRRIDLQNTTEQWFYSDTDETVGVIAKLKCDGTNRAQTVCKALLNGTELITFQTNGTRGNWIFQKLINVQLEKGWYHLTLEFPKPGMQVANMEFSSED